MCSNEVLNERCKTMKDQNDRDHKILRTSIVKVETKLDKIIDKLDDKYVMRREFKVAIGLLWAFATVVSIVWFFLNS